MIFVLGARGFVGSAFVRACAASGREVVEIERDDYASHAGKRCKILINANGNSSKLLAMRDPLAEFDASVRTVRASLADFQYDLYVHISSGDVYPDCSSAATTREDAPIDATRQSAYGFHKRLAELCVQHAAREWLMFRLGGMVGPGMKKNAIFDILHGGPLWLDPASELQYMPTDSVAEIVLRLAASGARREVFNLAGRGLIRLDEVMAAVGPVTVTPGSPRVRYELSVEKISRMVEMPETRRSVLEFVSSAEAREAPGR